MQKLIIFLLIVVSLVGIHYFNRWLQALLAPRRSFGRFMAYLVLSLGLLFLYTFSVVLLILKLFPLPKR